MCCGVSGYGTMEVLREAILGATLSGTGLLGSVVSNADNVPLDWKLYDGPTHYCRIHADVDFFMPYRSGQMLRIHSA